MSKNNKPSARAKVRRGRDRHISIRSELRKEPDLHKIAGAVIALAMAQAEKEAEAQRRSEQEPNTDA